MVWNVRLLASDGRLFGCGSINSMQWRILEDKRTACIAIKHNHQMVRTQRHMYKDILKKTATDSKNIDLGDPGI